jgi:REP element-mobilizing transposase RayT
MEKAGMPRPQRLHVPAAHYHVTLRGNHRQNIFFCPADRQLFEEITAEVLDRFTARLHAYCWMTNHVHMLIQVGDTPLGRLMLRTAGRYARAVQKQLRTTGHLFEKRYHPVLVDADEYLLELLRYIHLNPVRARMVEHPSDYQWSSHHAYLGGSNSPWVTTEFALRMFHCGRQVAIGAYRQFIDQDVGRPRCSPLQECNPADRRILGSDDFAGRLLGAAWKAEVT